MKFTEAGWVGVAHTVNATTTSVRYTKRITKKGVDAARCKKNDLREKMDSLEERAEARKAAELRAHQIQVMVGTYSSPMVVFMSSAEQKGVARYKALHLKALSSTFPEEKQVFEDKALELFLGMCSGDLRERCGL